MHAKDRKMMTTCFFLFLFFFLILEVFFFFLPFLILVMLGKRTEVSFPFGNMFSGGLLVLGRVKTGGNSAKIPGQFEVLECFNVKSHFRPLVTNAYGNLTKKEAKTAQGGKKPKTFSSEPDRDLYGETSDQSRYLCALMSSWILGYGCFLKWWYPQKTSK